jgi:hypothetical protein
MRGDFWGIIGEDQNIILGRGGAIGYRNDTV